MTISVRETITNYAPLAIAILLLTLAARLEFDKGPIPSSNEQVQVPKSIAAVNVSAPHRIEYDDNDVTVKETYAGEDINEYLAIPVEQRRYIHGSDAGGEYKKGITVWTTHQTIDELDVSNGDIGADRKWHWDQDSKQQLELQWFKSPMEVCQLLNTFKIEFIGQSTDRRLLYALESMAYGIPAAFKNSDRPPSLEQKLADTKQVRKFRKSKRFEYCVPGMRHLSFVAGQYGMRKVIYDITKEERFSMSFHDNLTAEATSLFVPPPRSVVVVNYGLYGLTRRNIRLGPDGKDGVTFSKLQKIFKALAKAQEAGVLVIFKTMSPVNATSPRFIDYEGKANEVVGAYNARALQLARDHGFCLFDSYRPLMRALLKNQILFEPKAIHMTDTGRVLTAQLFLNVLRVCARHKHRNVSQVDWYQSQDP